MTTTLAVFDNEAKRETLKHYLNRKKIEHEDKDFTHTSYQGGKYRIPDDEYDYFLQLYYEQVGIACEVAHLTEKHKQICPIVVDLDLHFSSAQAIPIDDTRSLDNLESHYYTTDHLKRIARAYCHEIIQHFIFTRASDRYCFVFEKPSFRKKETEINDGIHIIFPGIITEPNVQMCIRSNILDKLKPILNDMHVVNPVFKIVDPLVIYQNPWTMYRSAKRDSEVYYEVTHVYDFVLPDGDLIEIPLSTFTTESFVKMFSIRSPKMIETRQADPQYFTIQSEMLLSGNTQQRKQIMNKIKEEVDVSEVQKIVLTILNPERANTYFEWISVGWCLHNINPSDEFLNLWIKFSQHGLEKHKSRSEENCAKLWPKMHNDGYSIGTLYHWAKKDSPEKFNELTRDGLHKLMIESQTQTHFDVALVVFKMFRYQYVCVNRKAGKWYEFINHRWVSREDGPGLRMALSTDVFKEYKMLIQKLIDEIGDNAPQVEHTSRKDNNVQLHKIIEKINTIERHFVEKKKVSDELSEIDKLKVKFAQTKRLLCETDASDDPGSVKEAENVQRLFEDLDDCITEFMKINYNNTELKISQDEHRKESVALFEDMRKLIDDFMNAHKVLSNPVIKQKIAQKKAFEELLVSLKTTVFKNNVMRELSDMFYDINIIKKFDESPYLLGFENGVFDFKLMEFRNGKYDDFITYSTGYDYVPYETVCDTEEFHNVQKFLTDVLPNDAVRVYFLKTLSASLDGRHRKEQLHILNGVGANAKSRTVKLILEAFGDYGKAVSVVMITSKRPLSTSPTPFLAGTQGARVIIFGEPDKTDIIYIGVTKEMTGGDRLAARRLYETPIEFVPQFSIFLHCNDLPSLSCSDPAIWRRLRIIDFLMKFTDNPNPDKPNEKMADETIFDKIPNWKSYFMAWLMNIYKTSNDNPVPHEVVKASREYEVSENSVMDYISTNIEKRVGDSVSITVLYNRFTKWYKEQNRQLVFIPKKNDVVKIMNEKFGEATGTRNAWENVGFVNTE